MAKIGEIIDGKYEVLSLIGEGGMSRVWLARDKRLNKLWAVKEIGRTAKDANNTVVVQSLIAEANLMKKLDHPTLPRIVDIIENGKTIFVVMDYVEGESLSEVMKRLGHAMNETEVIDWGIQLCDVLEYLHTRTPPVIYRDMKPSNIMLRDDGTVKLIDFGIAREYKEDRSSDTKILGTRAYAPPEQFSRNAQTDPRSDIYSLGVTMHHLVTGRHPSDDPVIRPIRELNPKLSEGLEYILRKATQQDPSARYQSCAEMRYDLENYEKMTQEYRGVQKAKLKKFSTLCILAVSFALLGGVCLATSSYFKNSTFESYMQQAAAASVEEVEGQASAAEQLYSSAIGVEPGDIVPYQALVNDVYKADWNFTIAEASRWSTLFTANRSDLAGLPEYAKLCYDVGTLFYVYYEQSETDGEERTYAMSGGVQAAQWYQYAIDSYDEAVEAGRECTLTPTERRAAATYVTIGQFYRKLSQETLEGNEGSVYEGYWDSLEQAFEGLSEEDPVMVKLRLYELVSEAVCSPTYLNGFRRAGVDEGRAADLMERVLAATKELEADVSSNEKSQSMYDAIIGSAETTKAAIESVYGNVGVQTETNAASSKGADSPVESGAM